MWIPVNKKTGVRYPEVDDAKRKAMEVDRLTAGKYRFEKADSQATRPARSSVVNTTATPSTGKAQAKISTLETPPPPVEAKAVVVDKSEEPDKQ